MNIFSNVGITELIVILLLALLVVGPERLPELAEKAGKLLRDVRQAYENLTRDLGPELTSLQKTTQELRDSVQSVRSIPDDMVKTITKAADLDDTFKDIKSVQTEVGQIGKTLSDTKKAVQHPVDTAISAARASLTAATPAMQVEVEDHAAEENAAGDAPADEAPEPPAGVAPAEVPVANKEGGDGENQKETLDEAGEPATEQSND